MKNRNSFFPTYFFLISILFLCVLGCQNSLAPQFECLDKTQTGIDFNNTIEETGSFNILTNEYIFNGGGIAVADFNKDGLPDLYFTGNQVPNRLYLNQGAMRFEDITQTAQVAAKSNWSTGVAIADVNADGWIDIFVCTAMHKMARENVLFVHQGLTKEGLPYFKEQAAAYGLNATSNSMAAAFLDYDQDGYLDLYVVNNEQFEFNPNNYRKKITDGSAPNTDQLYRNNGDGTFTEVSKQAGIVTEGFGLSVSISDFNKDGWPDIYVTNDFMTNDLLYINQQDGTFQNKIGTYLPHQSKFSMGSDVGDINNDGVLDLITLDMLGESNFRKKTTISGYSYLQEQQNIQWEYEDQHIRNMLFLGNKNAKEFSEIGRFAGIYQTDWSWSPLFADMDNDGFKDLLITNGFPRDITDMDFANYRLEVEPYMSPETLLEKIPVVKIENYAFKNNGNLTFTNTNNLWGLNQKSFSNGAVFSDLDLDGDLDYVVNNINDAAFVFKNNVKPEGNNFIQFQLNGDLKNPMAIGSKIVIRMEDESFQFDELQLSKGYMSSVDPLIHFGLGIHEKITQLEVVWPDGKYTTLKDLAVNKRYILDYKEAKIKAFSKLQFPLVKENDTLVFKDISQAIDVAFLHQENELNDFAHHPLLPHKISASGPAIVVGDVNGDGLKDFIVGSALGFSPTLFVQTQQATFQKKILFNDPKEKAYEVTDMALFDVDNDGDLDLYLVSGGGYFNAKKTNMKDRLLINNGSGIFSKGAIEGEIHSNGTVVISNDYDQDGDIDLFVGAGTIPGQYPLADKSYLIENRQGSLVPIDLQNKEVFKNLKLVSAAKWVDINGDGIKDMVVVGSFSAIQIFINNGGVFEQMENDILNNTKGFWRCVVPIDFDLDGDQDLVLGNLGANNSYNISPQTPLEVIAKDVDNNGVLDPVIFSYQKNEEGKLASYPIHFWKNLNQQSPFFRQKFSSFKAFSRATKNDYLEDPAFDGAHHFEVNEAQSMLLENLGNGKFDTIPLPTAAQLAPINAIYVEKTGTAEQHLFLIGNDFGGNPFEGKYDALNGLILKVDTKKRQLQPKPSKGFLVKGKGSAIKDLELKNKNKILLVGQNQDSLILYSK